MINIALYKPDIPQNTGAIVRLAACLNLKIHINKNNRHNVNVLRQIGIRPIIKIEESVGWNNKIERMVNQPWSREDSRMERFDIQNRYHQIKRLYLKTKLILVK